MRELIVYLRIKVKIRVPDENQATDLDLAERVCRECDYNVSMDPEEGVTVVDTEILEGYI